jgi:hypothetical protein
VPLVVPLLAENPSAPALMLSNAELVSRFAEASREEKDIH